VPALALAAVLSGCSAGAAPEPAPAAPVPVRLAPAAPGPVERPIRAAGSVASRDAWTLSFKVGGVVSRVLVREGDVVRRGQRLAELDATEVAAGVRQAREALAKAERDRDRARRLRAAEAVPAAAAEDAETGAALAAASVASAEFNLSRTAIFAPDDGWVDGRLVEPGEIVAPGQPVLRASGRGGGWVVRAALADRDALGLEAGRPASVTLDARPGAPIPGAVSEVARNPSPATGTYEVEIRLDAARAPRDLLSGLPAKVEIARTVPAAARVPLASVVDGDGERGAVYVVERDRARRVPVRIAFLQGDSAVLAGGLAGGEQVVTDGATRLADGDAVAPVP
jgi:RND family efflux transporter MFP subunit